MGKSSRSIKKKKPIKNDKTPESYTTISKSDFLPKRDDKTPSVRSGNMKIMWIVIASSLLIVLLFTGFFSPRSNPTTNEFVNNENLPENTFTQENGLKISVVLYSSPTCGCCHKYVEYLNDNGFDTFQKRTEAYMDIKDENMIPENYRSCHTAIIGDYFIEGHIPLSVVFDLLSQTPDIDGISLPEMPDGSPGMEIMGGEKNSDWVISSISNGQVVGIFAVV